MPQYALRLPEDLYERATQMAREQGVSLNQFLLYAVSHMVADIEARSFFDKHGRPSREDAKATLKTLLAKVPKRPPDEGDQLESGQPVASKSRATTRALKSPRGGSTAKK